MSRDIRELEVEVSSQSRKVRELEERLSKLRWRKVQNVSALSSTLRSTRKMRENDIVSDMAEHHISGRHNTWMKSIVEDELSRPLALPEYASLTKPNLLELERDQRREYQRFDSHLRSVRKLAQRVARKHNSRRHLERAGKEALTTATVTSKDRSKSDNTRSEQLQAIKYHLERQKKRYDRSIRRIVKLQKFKPTWRTREPF